MKQITIAYRNNETHKNTIPAIKKGLETDGYQVAEIKFPEGTEKSAIKQKLEQETLDGFLITDTTVERELPQGNQNRLNLDKIRRETIDSKIDVQDTFFKIAQEEQGSGDMDRLIFSDYTALQKAMDLAGHRYIQGFQIALKNEKPDTLYVVSENVADYEEHMQQVLKIANDPESCFYNHRKRFMEKKGLSEAEYPQTVQGWMATWVKKAGHKGKISLVDKMEDIPEDDLKKDTLVLAHHHAIYKHSRKETSPHHELGKLVEEKYIDVGCIHKVGDKYGLPQTSDDDKMYAAIKTALD